VNPDYADHPDRMQHAIVNPAVWQTMADYMRGKPKEQFKKPDNNKMAFGDQRSIPDVTCDSIGDARSRLQSAGFTVSIGAPVDSRCPAGTAAGTNPSGRTIKGGVVVIQPSNGKQQQGKQPSDKTPPFPGFPVPRPRG
jgi:PASTA domain